MLSFIDERLITVEEEPMTREYCRTVKRENDLSDIDKPKSFLKQTVNIASSCWKLKHNIRIISMVDSFLNKPENKYSWFLLRPVCLIGERPRRLMNIINCYWRDCGCFRTVKDSNLLYVHLPLK